jgi:hypothetical protein
MLHPERRDDVINRDPRCVFVADSLGLAEVIAGWLSDQGIEAQAMDTATLGGFDGLTWLSSTGISARGIEVWVKDLGRVAEAQALLEAHGEALAAQASRRREGDADIEVVCEECGETNTFPAADSGKVQSCRHCGGFIDVPGEEDDLGIPDGENRADEEE